MALLDLGVPPAIAAASHRDYVPWLEHRCFDRTCAYCLEHGRVLEVDHVVPFSLAPGRHKDPTNLLPACATCNGPTGKWDYHPTRKPRKRCPTETHGHLPLDPRSDDYAQLYTVRPDGSLEVNDGAEYDRALWNRTVLFRLDRPNLAKWRRTAQDLARAAESLIADVETRGPNVSPAEIDRRDVIVREVAQRLLFFEIFELHLSAELRSQASAMRDALRGAAP